MTIDNLIGNWSPDQDRELLTLREILQKRLNQLLQDDINPISLAIRESILSPGKRIRALLLILVANDLNYKNNNLAILDLACAVEMIHAASLILDDLPSMDNTLWRRGRSTIHRKFGENVAILAAIALLSKAFGVAATISDLSGECCRKVISELSIAIGELVKGQWRDLNSKNDIDAIITTNKLKTSMLFNAALQIVAILVELKASLRYQLNLFAKDIGQAYQLLDDLIDSNLDDADKVTLITILGPHRVLQRIREYLHSVDQHWMSICPSGQITRNFIHMIFNQQLTIYSNSK